MTSRDEREAVVIFDIAAEYRAFTRWAGNWFPNSPMPPATSQTSRKTMKFPKDIPDRQEG